MGTATKSSTLKSSSSKTKLKTSFATAEEASDAKNADFLKLLKRFDHQIQTSRKD